MDDPAGRLGRGATSSSAVEAVKARRLLPLVLGRRVIGLTENAGESAPNPAGCADRFYSPLVSFEGNRPERSSARRHLAVVADEVKTTTCYMCACRCGIRVHLKDGQIRYIEGNPDHPVNRGVLCAKGSAGIMQQDSPAKPDQTALAHRPARVRRVPRDRVGGGVGAWRRLARPRSAPTTHARLAFFTGRDQSQALTGWWAQPVRHAQLRRPWRLLLGQHGGRRPLHDRRLVLGVRRAGLGAHPLLHAVRRRRGP